MEEEKREKTTMEELSQRSSNVPPSVPFTDENGMRDFIFRNYKETFAKLISGRKPEPVWEEAAGFPPVAFSGPARC